jgi:anaerobic dimethyl sulfoxide reductase subunit A
MVFHATLPSMIETILPVSCNKDCGAGCPLVAHIDGGRIEKITDNPDRPRFMQGCVRGYQAHRAVYSPERLRTPLIRTGNRDGGRSGESTFGFREAGWDEALDLVAERLGAIKDEHGASSVMHIGGSGSCRGAVHHTGNLTDRFLSLFGGYTDLSGSYSSGAEQFILPYVFGTTLAGMDAENLLESRLIILWGANISDVRFGCETENVIREARKRGTEVIALDPRRTKTVRALADDWIPLFPGSDAAMMAAVLHVLIKDNLVDRRFIDACSAGFEGLQNYILGATDGVAKSPEWAEPLCGVPASRIARFARRYGETKPTALIPGLSIQRTLGGEEAFRMSVALQTATGNIGIPGGSSGTNMWGRMGKPRFPTPGRVPGWDTSEIKYVPVYRWPDAVLEGEAGGYPSNIKCLYVVGGNYLCTGSDVHKNIRAFDAADFSICQDLFMTPTARHCDVVLPVTSFLEREDVTFTGGNFLLYSAKAADPVGEAMNDYDIFASLAERLGFGSDFTAGLSSGEWLERLIHESEITDPEEFKRTGMFILPDRNRVAFSDFVADPEKNPLNTPTGRIEISSAEYAKTGFSAFPTYRGFRPPADWPLYLITPHARFRINSQNTNVSWFAEREKPELTMNPDDAAFRKIRNGDIVRVFNDMGSLHIPVSVSGNIMPGVVCLPAGAWIGEEGPDGFSGGCANVLTSTEPTLPSESTRTHSIGVEVEAVS